jgi:predicted MFS family arabinose efflux permease
MSRLDGSRRSIGALAALSLAAFAYVSVETLPVGLLLSMATDLRTTPSAVGLLVTCYGLVVVVTSIPLTRITNHIPRRRLMIALLAVFVVATLGSAFAGDYRMLLVARVVTALSQALFWSIVVPAAAGLFPSDVRARVVGTVFAGSSLAAVVGVPLGTWLGQLAGWRTAFVAFSVIGLVILIGVVALFPRTERAGGDTERAPAPDARTYWVLMTMLALTVTGSFVLFTYVTPVLVHVAGLPMLAIGPVLLVRGIAGVVGAVAVGPLADRRPMGTVAFTLVVQAASLAGLWLFGTDKVIAIIMVGATGLAFAMVTTALSSQVLQIAPGSLNIAAAIASTSVNVGITAGALVGSVVLSAYGPGGISALGAGFTVIAIAVMGGIRRTRRTPPGPDTTPARTAVGGHPTAQLP